MGTTGVERDDVSVATTSRVEASDIVAMLADHGIWADCVLSEAAKGFTTERGDALVMVARASVKAATQLTIDWRCAHEPVHQIIELQEHCCKLGGAIQRLSAHIDDVETNEGEVLRCLDASQWLELAGGVRQVEILTGILDDSALWCGPVADYENSRGEVLSRFVAELTTFNFSWNAFETVAKLLELPMIPKQDNPKGTTGIVDRAIFYLRTQQAVLAYEAVLDVLGAVIQQTGVYHCSRRSQAVPPYMGITGLGIDTVRRLRNRFAHGTLQMPEPEDWGCDAAREIQVVRLSTRLVLLTIQMLLHTYMERQDVAVDDSSSSDEPNLCDVLRTLHLRYAIRSRLIGPNLFRCE